MSLDILSILILNISIFSLIFWLLTILGELFVKKYKNIHKIEFYECGFKAFHTNYTNFNFNFMLIMLFLILYDVEFLIFTPFFINFNINTQTTFVWLIIFSTLIIASLWFDWLTNALNWNFFGN